MTRLDLGTYLKDDALPLDNVPSAKHPKGKTYRVASPSAAFGLQLRRMLDVWGAREEGRAPSAEDVTELLEIVTGDDGQPIDINRRLLGDAYDEMIADGVSAEHLQQIVNIVMAYYGMGAAMAEAIVAGPGEAPARPNRAARRGTAKKTAGSGSPKGSGATTGSALGTASRTSRSSTSAKPVRPRKAG